MANNKKDGIMVSIELLPKNSPIREEARQMNWDLFLKELKKLRRQGFTVEDTVKGFKEVYNG